MDNLKAKEPLGPLGLPLSSPRPHNCPPLRDLLRGELGRLIRRCGTGPCRREGRGPPHMASPSKTTSSAAGMLNTKPESGYRSQLMPYDPECPDKDGPWLESSRLWMLLGAGGNQVPRDGEGDSKASWQWYAVLPPNMLGTREVVLCLSAQALIRRVTKTQSAVSIDC